jgi:hypothetical protein
MRYNAVWVQKVACLLFCAKRKEPFRVNTERLLREILVVEPVMQAY